MNDIYVHSMSPFLIQFTETLGIRWYGLAYLGGFLTTYLFASYLARRNLLMISQEKLADFITYGAIGTLAGGRIGYVLFYKPSLLLSFSDSFPFWGLLEVHKGGMASHGGILGIMVACWIFARKENIPWQQMVDLSALGGGFAIFYGRIANFINGELYGRVAEGVSWAVKFPSELLSWKISDIDKMKSLSPAVEALGESKEMWERWVMDWPSFQGKIQDMLYTLVDATQKGNEAVSMALGSALTPRYPSQLIQAGLEGLLVAIVMWLVWAKPRKPGVVSAWFGFTYAVARIIGEQYRLPDAHIGFELFGLTRGQWLSIGFILIAAIYLYFTLKADNEKVGGWLQPKQESK